MEERSKEVKYKVKAKAKKKFTPHMMYDKSGKGKMANTHAEHLALGKKGYGHTKPKGK